MRTRASIAGHPIHVMAVAIPIGLWIFSLVCDVIQVSGHNPDLWFTVAYITMAGGLVGALVAAVFGFIDLVGVAARARARRRAHAHGAQPRRGRAVRREPVAAHRRPRQHARAAAAVGRRRRDARAVGMARRRARARPHGRRGSGRGRAPRGGRALEGRAAAVGARRSRRACPARHALASVRRCGRVPA